MKLISVTLLPLVLLINSAAAQPTSQCKLPAPATAFTCGTGDEPENAEQRNLEFCDVKWNEKLRKNHCKLEEAKVYRIYYDKWKDSPAQRPPKPPIPELTRASYRQYVANCLQDIMARCPAGAPEQK